MAAGVRLSMNHFFGDAQGNYMSDSSAGCKTSGLSDHKTSECEEVGLKLLTTAVHVNHEREVGTNSLKAGM